MSSKSKPTKKSIPVTSVRHKDKRANIPTKELSKFLAEDEAKPKTVKFPVLLYARDPSLDPQLVWKEKDEQDRQPLEVPAVPIYIQEKVHPQALIENLRETAKAGEVEPEFQLFKDFNGIKFEQLIEFYQHKDGVNWSNRFVLGDSLLVMTSLAEKEGLKGKVQCLYFDPPYGIKFGSNWQVSTRKRDVKDGNSEDLTRQPEQVRAFRDTWKLGIHSYLSYLRDRLTSARELLTESGSVFVQIGEMNVHLVRSVLDEVFGSENFCSQIIYVTTSTQGSELLPTVNDNLLWYAKDRAVVNRAA
jgi:adenine-specific DNA-methyltransferase